MKADPIIQFPCNPQLKEGLKEKNGQVLSEISVGQLYNSFPSGGSFTSSAVKNGLLVNVDKPRWPAWLLQLHGGSGRLPSQAPSP